MIIKIYSIIFLLVFPLIFIAGNAQANDTNATLQMLLEIEDMTNGFEVPHYMCAAKGYKIMIQDPMKYYDDL